MTRRDPAIAAVSPQTIRGVEQQTRLPDAVFIGRHGLAQALTSDPDWLWLVARGAVPRADALQRLLDCTTLADEVPPLLLAGSVLDAQGRPLSSELPTGNQQHPDLARLVGKHALPIRSSTFANCLVARDCFVRHGLPDEQRYGRYAAVEWSARALRENTGYFIPASMVVLEVSTNRPAAVASISALLRTFRAGAWTRGEALHQFATALTEPTSRAGRDHHVLAQSP